MYYIEFCKIILFFYSSKNNLLGFIYPVDMYVEKDRLLYDYKIKFEVKFYRKITFFHLF